MRLFIAYFVVFVTFTSCLFSEESYIKTFDINQRSSIETDLPAGKITFAIGDITGGQVTYTISSNGKEIKAGSIEEKSIHEFELDGSTYYVKCIYLNNQLIGNDSGQFTISNEKFETNH